MKYALLAFIFLVIIDLLASAKTCTSKWQYSGMESRWGIMSGCLVQTSPGKWLPEESIRDIK